MIRTLFKLAFSVAVVLGCTYLFWFVEVTDVRSAILFVAVIGLLNIFVKPLLTILTIPITIFTLGFFLCVLPIISLMVFILIHFGIHFYSAWCTLCLMLYLNHFIHKRKKHKKRKAKGM
jgi:putative membrane protein